MITGNLYVSKEQRTNKSQICDFSRYFSCNGKKLSHKCNCIDRNLEPCHCKWRTIHRQMVIWNFSPSVQLNISLAEPTNETLIWTQEEKFHISKQPTNYFVYYINISPTIRSQLDSHFKKRPRSHSFMVLNIEPVTSQQLIGYLKHTWKIIIIIHMWWYGFSQQWKSLLRTPVDIIKWFIHRIRVTILLTTEVWCYISKFICS